MELYASGFNAWNQLQFGGSQEGEPYDLRQFEKVLSDEGIDIWRIGFSSTLGEYCLEISTSLDIDTSFFILSLDVQHPLFVKHAELWTVPTNGYS